MSNRIFYSEYFYQKGSKDTSVLERNANEYPYSSLASFLLLYHYKKTSNPAFEKFAKKTALLFNNPHWLQFQLFDKSTPISEQEIASDENLRQGNEERKNDNGEIKFENLSTENVMEESALKSEQENSIDEIQTVINDNKKISLGPSFMEDVREESVSNFGQETFSDERANEESAETIIENSATSSEHSSVEKVMEETAAGHEESTLKETGVEEIKEMDAETILDTIVEESIQQEPGQEANLEEPTLNNSLQTNEFIETKNTLNETPVTKNTATEIASTGNAETEKETTVNENETIAFEPLHTVDYFASQGIKITEELLTKDKLGSQMKSFTAWLKSMKKVHPGKLEEQSLATEKLIQASANESNFNTEILTEAMAEVLIKQDKKDKAIEMFSKLSLINPSKSAYFAARIESIKSS
jgi:hypothetical protein